MENKVSIKLPEWADNVSCQVSNGMVDVEFIPKKEFKDGDVLASDWSIVVYKEINERGFIICYNGLNTIHNELHFFKCPDTGFGMINSYKHATEGEKQKLFDAMAKEGLKWNAENKQVEKIRWRAERGGGYFYISSGIEIGEAHDHHYYDDVSRYNNGNYFKTEEEAELKAEKIKELLKGD